MADARRLGERARLAADATDARDALDEPSVSGAALACVLSSDSTASHVHPHAERDAGVDRRSVAVVGCGGTLTGR
jgi:hypothetical protein